MKEFIWRALAKLVANDWAATWLIKRAKKTPYLHILSPAGDSIYMERYWLLNPYDRKTNKPRWSWLPFSVRIHHIHRPDYDDHCHDHPWDARTIILRGWYEESRLIQGAVSQFKVPIIRVPGDTASLKFGEYHQIDRVGPGGAVTLFFTWKYKGSWGYWVDGVKVYWKTYQGIPEDGDLPQVPPRSETGRFSGTPGREGCAWSPDGKHMSFGGMVEQPDGALRREERCICCGEEL